MKAYNSLIWYSILKNIDLFGIDQNSRKEGKINFHISSIYFKDSHQKKLQIFIERLYLQNKYF